jgi:large subunit ribosomal protein L25
MSKTKTELNATLRSEMGHEVARLRRAGKLPAVVFGHGMESIPVTLDAHEFEIVRRSVHSNTIVDLKVGSDLHRVMVHGVQVDPRTRHLQHVDLFAIKTGEEVTVEIPLRGTGHSVAVDRLGGTLLFNIDRIRVRALPDKLPDAIEFSVEPLVDFEAAIHLRELPMPAGVTLLSDPEEIVAKVAAPKAAEEATPAATEEAAAEAPVAAPAGE